MDCYQKYIPNIVNKTRVEIDELIERLRSNTLSKEDADFFVGCTELSVWLPHALQEKDISINNLRRQLFGATSKKGEKNKENKGSKNAKDDKGSKNNNEPDQSAEKSDGVDASSENIQDNNITEPSGHDNASTNQLAQTNNVVDINAVKKRGHGRMGFAVYKNAEHIPVGHSAYKAGDNCPTEECGGKLYPLPPGHVTRIVGNPPFTVKVFEVEKLRCSSCTMVFTADLPLGVSTEKYDYVIKAQIALQKYFMGMPFYRQQDYYTMLESPLQDATQFELCEQVANAGYRVVGALEKLAANAELAHFDDTHAKILSVIAQNKANEDQHIGMHTTGIIAKTFDEKTIALFYTGTSHAGDNLTALLQHRIDDKEKIIAMCDALAANMPKSLQAILCNCMGHGLRKFRDLLDYFPQVCLYVVQELGRVYEIDEQTKGMSKLERLAYHRKHSKPIMLKLYTYLKKQLADKLVEPNSRLGKAIKYMLKHWKRLRRFLTTPGAPIDNNIVERALKIPIRNRKAAMFYKTVHGAEIGNILVSLIYTAKLANVNPIEYLVALQENKSAVHKNPDEWVPWKFKETLKNTQLKADSAIADTAIAAAA